ncbi:hypothetical protein EEB12_28300 [Rhodococcus sp. WS1]|uniref:hypothetical protein n=1 Tax=unclassified Rhodococcus (in: high G+C Gram-positive bacteria) TaxID=192944 RepID=UPI0011412E8F|nr:MULTISPECIES: hypothetical protein [unclassified Rhodococcus (in: high G+C Gram-positive bacteria)]ROZ52762.1 hypothetical protein EEB12_28300 [Rhodococcus sp. WS1]TQC34285.1 hypothetical protein EEB16_29290 [Rhodococcus sp. WS7]
MNEQREHAMWVNRLIDAAMGGLVVDLRFGAPIRQYNPATADQWPAERCIPASALRTVLLGDHTGFDPRGLRIAGARITGDVDLAHITFDYPLHMVRCRIDRPIAFDAAKLAELDLTASHIRSLSVDGATITGALFANRIITHGMISAVGATIGSQLSLTGAHLNNPGADVLTLDGATITSNLFANQITTHGMISGVGATIGSQLILTDAHLNNPGADVLALDNATVTGSLFADKITTHGEILTVSSTIGSQLILTGAYLNNPGADVLSLDGATITRGLIADQITTHGMISGVAATIGKQLSLTDAHLNNPGADILTLNGATITGGLIADQITTHGEIRAVGATIGGELNLSGAHLNNPEESVVLDLHQARIAGDIDTSGVTTYGEIRAVGATIGGELNLNGAHLNNPEQWVLDLDGANITGDVFTGDFATATRWLTFKADGLITASNAGFEGHVDLGFATSSSSGHLTVDFSGVEMQQLTLPQSSLTEINLSLAKLTHLNTPTDREPSYPVLATGWAIGDIDGLIRTDHHAATRWLNCISKEQQLRNESLPPSHTLASPQPWHALAAVYERNGHPAEARRLRFTAANKVTKNAPLPTKILRTIYRFIAGHGYYPLRAGLWLIIALIAGVALVGANRAHFVPTTPVVVADTVTTNATGGNKATPTGQTEEQPVTVTGADDCASHPTHPCLDTFTYALTGVIPAATGITRPVWEVSPTAPVWMKLGLPALRILAWIFTAILLAGVTGLLRKSS